MRSGLKGRPGRLGKKRSKAQAFFVVRYAEMIQPLMDRARLSRLYEHVRRIFLAEVDEARCHACRQVLSHLVT
jgi:hypothetical protein